MRQRRLAVFLGLVLATSIPHVAAAETRSARDLAQSAYFELEANVFDRGAKRAAWEKLQRAHALEPEEPWVHLAASMGHLVAAYKVGDWYEAGTFVPEGLARAVTYGDRALELAPLLPHAMAHVARLRIVEKRFAEARKLTTKAARLNIEGFYPWYFEGILLVKLGHVEEAHARFDEAEKRAFLPHHAGLLRSHRRKLARIAGDAAAEESLHQASIEADPKSPHRHGNYASFLFRMGRLEEAERMWEKAIALGSYPLAVRRLEKTREAIRERSAANQAPR